MQVQTFIADSVADAVAQIRAELGTSAVVLNVRQQASSGLSRLWQKPRIEVLACIPEKNSNRAAAPEMSELTSTAPEIRPIAADSDDLPPPPPITFGDRLELSEMSLNLSNAAPPPTSWRIGPVLENGGLLPLHAQRVVEQLRSTFGDTPPPSMKDEFEFASRVLSQMWRPLTVNDASASRMHVFIGAPGVGKTTVLCKWLAKAVLLQGRSAAVWRLDGRSANTAESLSIYGEILGVPVHRCSAPRLAAEEDMLFVDFPGVDWNDLGALHDLQERVASLPSPQVHLVLHAAYDAHLSLAQVRAFSSLPITDLIFTHVDEETRWGKLWNFVLGTKYPARFLSGGQNIPGDFLSATAGRILDRQFSQK